ncbi:glycosyltransferase family 4 protein [uncultured Enterovirga sp.]|uniref:glycosyltransferase family 4 protein n=1 Tax=uncultured Enterovirga sp. TaxID=2026352 RepID=UPI0035C9457F
MALTILSVAYPLAPVSTDAVGGAEQVLARLDRALVAAGHRSIVIAQEGSRVAGEFVSVPRASGVLDEAEKAAAQARHCAAIAEALARFPVDLVHLHGIDFDRYLPPPGPPVLVTLHLPPDWYPAGALSPERPDTWFHAVSETQHRACPANPRLLAPIPNGIEVADYATAYRKRRYALILGRLCPEKGIHLAIEAARQAGIPLAIAGEAYPYTAHLDYLRDEIRPRLDRSRRLIGPVGGRRKRRLLGSATCLLVPSLAPETSSLVAREAIAAGTPVIAFPAGALPETVDHGRTGFLVENADEMARAIPLAATLDPEHCRAVARERFSADRMIAAYLALYGRLASGCPQ